MGRNILKELLDLTQGISAIRGEIMQYKLIKGNQKNFENLLNEVPKGAEIVSFTCNNDASYFAALMLLSDAVIEKARDKSKDKIEKEQKAAIVLQKEKEAEALAAAKAKAIKEAEESLAKLKE